MRRGAPGSSPPGALSPVLRLQKSGQPDPHSTVHPATIPVQHTVWRFSLSRRRNAASARSTAAGCAGAGNYDRNCRPVTLVFYPAQLIFPRQASSDARVSPSSGRSNCVPANSDRAGMADSPAGPLPRLSASKSFALIVQMLSRDQRFAEVMPRKKRHSGLSAPVPRCPSLINERDALSDEQDRQAAHKASQCATHSSA